ncbi:ATP-binding protein [Galbibacter sp. PAP.153]|uniref:ATP-binding protein n=1 Tax=Galbibacter sp. PAP.153 TaxID=3104623 RepID=UPI00300B0BF7
MEEKFKQKPGNIVKIVLFGPESTGKTTLAKSLAAHFNTKWVPEYMRAYLEAKWNTKKELCTKEDLPIIAEGQMKEENQLTLHANKVLFCDTNLLEIKVYSEAYYNGYCDPKIEKYALENNYELYFLTYIDVPWEEDVLRDKPNEREAMFKRFKNALDTYNKPYFVLKGNLETRLKQAINQVEKILKNDRPYGSR